jgi:hypothetical protein
VRVNKILEAGSAGMGWPEKSRPEGGRLLARVGLLDQALGRLVVVVLTPLLVGDYLAIEFVNQFVHGGIQIFVRAFGKQIVALDVNIALCALAALFLLLIVHGQSYLHIHHLVEVAYDAIKLGRYITAHGGSDFQVLTADRQIHKWSPVAKGLKGSFTMPPLQTKSKQFFASKAGS